MTNAESGCTPATPVNVVVYAAGANGNVAPIRVISGSNTLLQDPRGIAVDPAGDVYVAERD